MPPLGLGSSKSITRTRPGTARPRSFSYSTWMPLRIRPSSSVLAARVDMAERGWVSTSTARSMAASGRSGLRRMAAALMRSRRITSRLSRRLEPSFRSAGSTVKQFSRWKPCVCWSACKVACSIWSSEMKLGMGRGADGDRQVLSMVYLSQKISVVPANVCAV